MRRVAALGATYALAVAGMFGAMAANADEESMSGCQSGSEQSGGNGGEEGGDEGVVVDGLEILAINGNVLDTTTMLFVTWNYTGTD